MTEIVKEKKIEREGFRGKDNIKQSPFPMTSFFSEKLVSYISLNFIIDFFKLRQ